MRDMTEPLDTYDDQGDYDWDYDESEDRGPRPKILWGRVISLVVFMLIAFLIGRASVSGPDQEEFDAAVAENSELETSNAELQEQLDQAQQALANANASEGDPGADTGGGNDNEPAEGSEDLEPDVYTVKSGDTLSRIVKKHYGCTIATNGQNEVDLTENVTDTNLIEDPAFDPALLAATQEILLPALPAGYECA